MQCDPPTAGVVKQILRQLQLGVAMSGLTRMAVAVFVLQTSLLNLSGIDIIQELALQLEAVWYSLLYWTLCEGVYWVALQLEAVCVFPLILDTV